MTFKNSMYYDFHKLSETFRKRDECLVKKEKQLKFDVSAYQFI